MRRILVVFLVAAIPIVVLADSNDSAEGGNGGVPFKYTCGAAAVLRGFGARTGSWFDAITPICAAAWGNDKGAVVRRPEPWFGGPGGGKTEILCPSGSNIVSMRVSSGMLTSHIRGVTQLLLACGNAGPSGKSMVAAGPLGGPDKPKLHRTELLCAPGQVALGVIGRSGKWLDQIGLICGPVPLPP